MIVDSLRRCQRYFPLHPEFKKAFTFLLEASSTSAFHPKRVNIQGKDVIAILEQSEGKSRQGAVLEAHRKYIDIQYTFSGLEEIGWRTLEDCHLQQAYDPEKDIAFFSDTPTLWIPLPQTSFAIFFPEDAHAPLATTQFVQKIIMKIAVEE